MDADKTETESDPRSSACICGSSYLFVLAVIAVAAFVLVNFVIAVAAPLLTDAAGIAWEAHIGGFAAGLLLLGTFDAPAPVEMEPPRA